MNQAARLEVRKDAANFGFGRHLEYSSRLETINPTVPDTDDNENLYDILFSVRYRRYF